MDVMDAANIMLLMSQAEEDRYAASALQVYTEARARRNSPAEVAKEEQDEDTEEGTVCEFESESDEDKEIVVASQKDTKSLLLQLRQEPTPPDSTTANRERTPSGSPPSNMFESLEYLDAELPQAIEPPRLPLRNHNKRKAEDDAGDPAKKPGRVPGGRTPEHLRSLAEKFGKRMKLMLNEREHNMKSQDVLDERIFSTGRSLHPRDGKGSKRYSDERELALSWGFTEKKGNMATYYVHKARFFEGVAMLLEHNLRLVRRDSTAEPLVLNTTQAQRWLRVDVKATTAMLKSFFEWGWVPVLLPTLTKDGKSKSEMSRDENTINAFCSPELRKQLYAMLVKYDEEHHANDRVFERTTDE